MFQIVSSTELAALQAGTVTGSLGVVYQLRTTGETYFWNPDTETLEGFTAAQQEALQDFVANTGDSGIFGPRVGLSSSGDWSTVGTWSHTRATANASVVDCYGSMQFALSGEARLRGWRRVCNALRFPEAMTNTTYWNNSAPANTTLAASTRRGPNHSRASAFTLTRTSGSAVMLTYTAASYRPGKWLFSAWVVGDGAQTYTIAIGATTQTVTPPVGAWTRIGIAVDIVNTTAIACTITNATSGAASFTVCDPQMEWVHNQTSAAPGDYVPRDVTSYPSALLALGYLHPDGGRAVGADGVRYYPTSCPWVLSSGTATRTATVVPIDPDLMLGMQFDPIETNQVYSSRDISAAQWTRSGSTGVNSTPADSTLLGKNSIYKLEEPGTSSVCRVVQSWAGTNPAANAALSVSFYAKAAERTLMYIGLRQLDGSTFTYSFFDLLTGEVTGVTAGNKAYMYKEGDMWRCCMTGPAGATGSTAPLFQIGVTTSIGTHVNAYTGTSGYGAWVGGVQFEDHGCPTAYIGDTGSAATLSRNADATSILLSNCPGIDFTIAFDYTPFFPTDTPWKDSWWYILSAYVNQQDRNAMGMRPNTFGGAGSGMEDEWFFDLYPNVSPAASSWDGVEILAGAATVRAGETIPVQWALAATGQTSGTSSAAGYGTTNQVARVGAVAATITGDTPRPTVNGLGSIPRTYWIGKQGEFLPQRGSFCLRNVSWRPRALTASEMAVVAP